MRTAGEYRWFGAVLAGVMLAVLCSVVAPPVGAVQPRDVPAAAPGSSTVVIPLGVAHAADEAVDAAGDVFVADYLDDRIVEVHHGGAMTNLGYFDPNVDCPPDSGCDFDGYSMTTDPQGDLYVADDGELTKLTPAGVRTTASLTGLTVAGIAADSSGDVFVAEGTSVVELLAAGGQQTLGFTGLTDAFRVAVDANGDVFAGQPTSVVELPHGGVQTTLSITGLQSLEDIAVDAAGDLYVADYSQSDIIMLPAGSAQTTAGFTDLDRPTRVAVDGAGDLFALDCPGQCYLSGSVVELPHGASQEPLSYAGVQSPGNVAVDAAGDVFVVDTVADDIEERTAAGSFKALPLSGVAQPDSLAVDPAGDVVVSDSRDNRVVELPAGGGSQVDLPFSGLDEPSGLAFDSNGDLFVCDSGNNRIEELTPAGVQSTVPMGALDDPSAVAVDAVGDVFVGLDFDGQVIELPAGASKPIPIGLEGVIDTQQLAVDAQGNVYGSGNQYYAGGGTTTPYLYVIDPAGTVTPLSVTSATYLTGVAADTAGDLFAAADGPDNGVTEISPNVPGTPTAVTAAPGDGQATVSWATTAFDGGSPVTSYTVTPYDDGTAQAPVQVSGSPATVSGLTNGDNYTFTVAATNVAGTGTASAQSAAIVDGAPQAPSGATATAGDGTSTLSWNAAPDDGAPITGYVVTPIEGGSAQPAISYSSTATTESIEGLAYSDNFSFTVAAVNSRGTGPASAPSTAVAEGAQPVPTEVVATPGDGQATVTWQAPATGNGSPVLSYEVTDRQAGANLASQSIGPTGRTATFTGLTNGATDTLIVQAVYPSGAGPAADSNFIVAGVPQAPAAPTATGTETGSSIDWTAPGGNGAPVTGYIVYRYRGGGLNSSVHTGSTATSYTVTGLVGGDSYTFAVAAINSRGTGVLSARSNPVIPPFPSLAALVDRQYLDFTGVAATGAQTTAGVAALEGGAVPGSIVMGLRRGSDATTNADPVARLYFAYFLRIPDAGGLVYWTSQKREGESLYAISDYFAGSAEFKTRYGSLSNTAFVTLVYQNVLDRKPDSGGLSYWVGQLNSGAKTRGQVMVGFSESNEYRTDAQPEVDVAVTWIDMYSQSPGKTLFHAWVADLTSGGKTVSDLAQAIFASANYEARINLTPMGAGAVTSAMETLQVDARSARSPRTPPATST